MSMPLGDWATWVASVGTVAAVSVALWQVVVERRRENRDRRMQSEEAQREQAELIAAWSPGRMRPPELSYRLVAVNLTNASRQAAYNVVLVPVYVQGSLPRTGEEWVTARGSTQPIPHKCLQMLPPGDTSIGIEDPDLPGKALMGIEFAFTDRSGAHWLRRSWGALERLAKAATDHYEFPQAPDYKPVHRGHVPGDWVS